MKYWEIEELAFRLKYLAAKHIRHEYEVDYSCPTAYISRGFADEAVEIIKEYVYDR